MTQVSSGYKETDRNHSLQGLMSGLKITLVSSVKCQIVLQRRERGGCALLSETSKSREGGREGGSLEWPQDPDRSKSGGIGSFQSYELSWDGGWDIYSRFRIFVNCRW